MRAHPPADRKLCGMLMEELRALREMRMERYEAALEGLRSEGRERLKSRFVELMNRPALPPSAPLPLCPAVSAGASAAAPRTAHYAAHATLRTAHCVTRTGAGRPSSSWRWRPSSG